MCGTLNGLTPDLFGTHIYSLNPFIIKRDRKFFESHKFFMNDRTISYNSVALKGGWTHCRYTELWNMCIQQVSPFANLQNHQSHDLTYRINTLSTLNSNLRTIQTLCKSNQEFNYQPLRDACNQTLQACETLYAKNPIAYINDMRKILNDVDQIITREEINLAKARFHELIDKSINACQARLEIMATCTEFSDADKADLKRYKRELDTLQYSSFSERTTKIYQLFQSCSKNLEAYNKKCEEKKAREDAASAKMRSLMIKMQPGYALAHYNLPTSSSLIDFCNRAAKEELTPATKSEIKLLLNSPDLGKAEKQQLSEAYNKHESEVTNNYLEQLNTIITDHASYFPRYADSWLLTAENISEEEVKNKLSATPSGEAIFATFIDLKKRSIEEIEKYFYGLNVNKTDHISLLKNLLDAKNIKSLENPGKLGVSPEGLFEVPKDSSDSKCMLLLSSVREFRKELTYTIYTPQWDSRLDDLRQKIKDQEILREGVTKLNRSLILYIARLQLMIEERKHFDELRQFAVKKDININPDEIDARRVILNEFNQMKKTLPKSLREKFCAQ